MRSIHSYDCTFLTGEKEESRSGIYLINYLMSCMRGNLKFIDQIMSLTRISHISPFPSFLSRKNSMGTFLQQLNNAIFPTLYVNHLLYYASNRIAFVMNNTLYFVRA